MARTRMARTRTPALVSTVALLLCLAPALASAAADDLPFKVGAPLSHEQLTIFPLYSTSAIDTEDMLTFEEAAQEGLLEVTELEGNTSDARVNSVHVSSKAEVAIFVMSGEVILGGKQDRIISQDTVIPPLAKKMEVGVFCVEHGRWAGNTANFEASGKLSQTALRGKAQFEADQSKVWETVSAENARFESTTNTDTYRESLANTEAKVAAYTKVLLPPLERDGKALGIAVAIGGKVVAIDAFMNPKLFAKARTKLVESYALQAAAFDGASAGKATREQVTTFLAEAEKAAASRAADSGEADIDIYEGNGFKGVQTKNKAKKRVHTFYLAD